MENKKAITYVNGAVFNYEREGNTQQRISCYFKVPEGLKPGTYEFTLFQQDETQVKYPKRGALAHMSGKVTEYVKKS